MLKDAFEDYKRHQSDAQENNKMCEVYDADLRRFVDQAWKTCRVGQVTRIKSEEFVPADVLILHTSDPKGVCYVETKNLDGETNLKIKNANKEIQKCFSSVESLSKLDGHILCERPNNAIYKFEGAAEFHHENLPPKVSLNDGNIILRGSSVRNTEFVFGLIVNTGHDTKIMRNSASAKYKFSKLEVLSNFSILIVFCTQIALASIGAFKGADWMARINPHSFEDQLCIDNTNPVVPKKCYNHYYLNIEDKESWFLSFIKSFGTWILIFTNFVPISLLVSLELVKLWQAIFMSYDELMFDEE